MATKQSKGGSEQGISITLKRDKECKGSVRFATDDPKAFITNAYISREMKGIDKAKEVVVTIGIL